MISTKKETVDTTADDVVMGEPDMKEHPLFFSEELKIALSLREQSPNEVMVKKVFLGKKTKKHTLVLDIDNTLVNAKVTETKDVAGASTSTPKILEVQVRPYTKRLLKEMSSLYEVVLFTAGNEEYASQIKEHLDPDGKLIKATLGSSSCTVTQDGHYVKDLRIFADREIKNIVIVDDKVASFSFQINNGIPVTPFAGVREDRELLLLMGYLTELYYADDIPEFNKKRLSIVNC